jgi:hypothetical protein
LEESLKTKSTLFARSFQQRSLLTIGAGIPVFGLAQPAEARPATIAIDSPASAAYAGASIGSAGPYVTLKGRVFGELDPSDPHNQIIQDKLGKGRE